MFNLKSISKAGIGAALEKAERYRLLNEPMEAQSICLDILEVEPENQRALVVLILAYSDQFSHRSAQAAKSAREAIGRLQSEYEREYYSGVVSERQGKAALGRRTPGHDIDAYEWFTEAMEYYEKAEKIRPKDNDEPILRWNTCVRIITTRKLHPRHEDNFLPFLE